MSNYRGSEVSEIRWILKEQGMRIILLSLSQHLLTKNYADFSHWNLLMKIFIINRQQLKLTTSGYFIFQVGGPVSSNFVTIFTNVKYKGQIGGISQAPTHNEQTHPI